MRETKAAYDTLSETTAEMENIHFEKKQLAQQWKTRCAGAAVTLSLLRLLSAGRLPQASCCPSCAGRMSQLRARCLFVPICVARCSLLAMAKRDEALAATEVALQQQHEQALNINAEMEARRASPSAACLSRWHQAARLTCLPHRSTDSPSLLPPTAGSSQEDGAGGGGVRAAHGCAQEGRGRG